MNIEEIKERMENVRAGIVLEQPFYGTVLAHIPLVPDEKCNTAATDGRRILYSPEYVGTLKAGELKFILLHELLHILLLHFPRRKDRDRTVWNIAADYVINTTLQELGYYGPSGVLFPDSTMDWLDKNAEVYYAQLINTEDEAIKKMIARLKAAHGDPVYGWAVPSDLTGDYADLTPEEEEEIRRLVKDAVNKAVIIGGKVPSLISELYFTSPKYLPWKKLLKEYLQESEPDDSSYCRPERKYLHMDMIVPGADPDENDLGEIWAFIDSSGSISEETTMEFLTQLRRILSSYSCVFNIAYWDTTVNCIYKNIRKKDDLLKCKPRWSGGTDVKCVYDYIENNRIQPYLMLILTDGQFDDMEAVPKPLRKNTIMVLSEDCGRDMMRYGKVAILE